MACAQNPALFRTLFTTARLAASDARTRQSAIGLDDAHQEIEKDFPLFSGKRRENTHLSRDHRRAQFRIKVLPPPRKSQPARTAVGVVDPPLDDSLFFQAVYEQACTVAVYPEPIGQTILIDIGLSILPIEISQHAHVERHEALACESFRCSCRADLQKTTCQREREPPDRQALRLRTTRGRSQNSVGGGHDALTVDSQYIDDLNTD